MKILPAIAGRPERPQILPQDRLKHYELAHPAKCGSFLLPLKARQVLECEAHRRKSVASVYCGMNHKQTTRMNSTAPVAAMSPRNALSLSIDKSHILSARPFLAHAEIVRHHIAIAELNALLDLIGVYEYIAAAIVGNDKAPALAIEKLYFALAHHLLFLVKPAFDFRRFI